MGRLSRWENGGNVGAAGAIMVSLPVCAFLTLFLWQTERMIHSLQLHSGQKQWARSYDKIVSVAFSGPDLRTGNWPGKWMCRLQIEFAVPFKWMVLCEQSTLPESKLEFTLRVYRQIGGFNKQPYRQGPKLTHAKSSKNQMQGTHHLANHFIRNCHIMLRVTHWPVLFVTIMKRNYLKN